MTEYEKQLNEKIEERLKKMEQHDYVFARRFTWKDGLVVFLVAAICLVFLILGAYL